MLASKGGERGHFIRPAVTSSKSQLPLVGLWTADILSKESRAGRVTGPSLESPAHLACTWPQYLRSDGVCRFRKANRKGLHLHGYGEAIIHAG